MPAFDYAARDPDGQMVRGCITAESPDQARKLLRRRELFVVDIHESRPAGLWQRFARLFRGKPAGPPAG